MLQLIGVDVARSEGKLSPVFDRAALHMYRPRLSWNCTIVSHIYNNFIILMPSFRHTL